jgi:hypothetical protein
LKRVGDQAASAKSYFISLKDYMIIVAYEHTPLSSYGYSFEHCSTPLCLNFRPIVHNSLGSVFVVGELTQSINSMVIRYLLVRYHHVQLRDSDDNDDIKTWS